MILFQNAKYKKYAEQARKMKKWLAANGMEDGCRFSVAESIAYVDTACTIRAQEGDRVAVLVQGDIRWLENPNVATQPIYRGDYVELGPMQLDAHNERADAEGESEVPK